MRSELREFYCSPTGDRWFLARDSVTGHAYVVHEPNIPSGGKRSRVEIGAFLRQEAHSPEHNALLRLIGSLVGARELRTEAEQGPG